MCFCGKLIFHPFSKPFSTDIYIGSNLTQKQIQSGFGPYLKDLNTNLWQYDLMGIDQSRTHACRANHHYVPIPSLAFLIQQAPTIDPLSQSDQIFVRERPRPDPILICGTRPRPVPTTKDKLGEFCTGVAIVFQAQRILSS